MKTLKINSYYSENYRDHHNGAVGFLHCGVYLHGEIEQIVGYDICAPDNADEFEGNVHAITHNFANAGPRTYKYLFLDGVFPCIVDGKYECTAFLWYNHEALMYGDDYDYAHGLIVLNTDKESMDYARKEYNERATSL